MTATLSPFRTRYWVRTRHIGRGIAPAAVKLLARFAFDQLSLNRVEIVVALENAKSRRVAEKVGARQEGILRKRIAVRGTVHDAVMYSLVAEDLA